MAIQDMIKGWPWFAQAGLFAGIAAGLFYVGHWQLIEPKNTKLSQLSSQRTALMEEINKGETLKARYIEFEAELKRLETQLETLKKILPESEEIADLYSRIQQEGTELGLNITLFKPGGHQAKEYYQEWPISMTLLGNYHTLAKFFERIGKLYRIINVNDVTVKSVAVTKGSSSSNTLTAACIATTFIYKEESATTAKKTSKKGGKK